MITFRSIEWRNFLSTGNAPNKVLLNKSPTTLIIGKNGEGKSTILDALCFSLFGKPFRDINKNQLINSINGKNALVTVEFSVNNKDYIVKRGIKPNLFEIWCDGELINQDAATKDYQKALEHQILRLNYKSFTQVVILGSASFVPFMQLTTWQRREVIEDILDIKIFSIMNTILKERASETKNEITRIESELTNAKAKVEVQQKLIETITKAKTDVIVGLQSKIDYNDELLLQTQSEIQNLVSEIAELSSKIVTKDKLLDDIDKAKTIKTKLTQKVETIEHNATFFAEHDVCPQCSQEISDGYKTKIIHDLHIKMKDNNKKIHELESVISGLQDNMIIIDSIVEQISQKNIELSTRNSTVKLLEKQNKQLKDDIQSYEDDTSDADEEKRKLKKLAQEAVCMVKTKTKLQEQRNLEEVSSILLKDTGIKTAIIREYLPVMNKLINKYLNAMDAYIHLELDESFNESVKSRHRDEFTYASFSEGEKQKIDLAILFTWRQIAKLKNSVNTNLLIMDEIFDSSLDSHGTDLLMNLLSQITQDTNVFVISHKSDALFDKFRSVIKFEKRNEFSQIAQP